VDGYKEERRAGSDLAGKAVMEGYVKGEPRPAFGGREADVGGDDEAVAFFGDGVVGFAVAIHHEPGGGGEPGAAAEFGGDAAGEGFGADIPGDMLEERFGRDAEIEAGGNGVRGMIADEENAGILCVKEAGLQGRSVHAPNRG
jgi:hypothetical protein